MAKSLRSKRVRKNKRELRKNVYEKVEAERNARCSKRLEADDPTKFVINRYTEEVEHPVPSSIRKRKRRKGKKHVTWIDIS